MKKHSIALALVSAIVSTGAIVFASSANFTIPHKWINAGRTYVYIPGQTAGSSIQINSPQPPVSRTLTPDDCGWGSIKKSPSSLITSISGVNWAGRATVSTPLTCILGSDGHSNGRPMDPQGTVVDDGVRIWMRGGTNPTMLVNVTFARTITSKVNACGFARVTVSDSRPMTAFQIGTTNYTLAAISTVTAPMICRRVGVNSMQYIPLNP